MSRPVQGGLTVAALVFVPLLAVAGSDGLRATLDFTTGVLSLVSLSAAVAWGLLATDRLFLSARQRLLCQGIHRATAVAALGFLLLHGTVKVALGHVTLLGALIPFGLGVTGAAGLIGFGSLAGLLMVVTAATGALRSAFAQPSPAASRLGQSLGAPRDTGGIAGRWRALHALAYPAWCFALIHGLYAGRAPATWVVVMYGLCLAAVAGALCLRSLPRPTKRRITDRIATLLSPEADGTVPDPVLRGSSPPGAQGGPGPDGEPGAPYGPGVDREPHPGDPTGWSEPGREVRGTPVRPRTLSAPAHRRTPQPMPPPMPPPSTPPPMTSPSVPLPGSLHSLHEAPTELLYGVGAAQQPPGAGPTPYEPPPRSSDRLADGPAAGPGISAGYRAVSRAGEAPLPPGARWPAPSPAPPVQARHRAGGAEHTYAPPQEPPLYTSPLHTTPSYAAPAHGTADATPSHGTPAHGTADAAPSYGNAPTHSTPSPSPAHESAAYESPAYRSAAYQSPTYESAAHEPHESAAPGSGPFSAPPAGEPWHAPAGDRP
ncbi:hypothetical protein [Streptomyces sp. cmx-18-6]|uniref:hypothetical protein n=1 Tax=Streptomyces sp. cmx-18-6 TaxID=2790930 RepID=UPI003980E8DB